MVDEIRICRDCEDEYTIPKGKKKPGFIYQCWRCGREEEEGKMRLGGVIHYPHKTGGTIQIMPMQDAKAVIKAGERNGGQGTLRSIVTRKSP